MLAVASSAALLYLAPILIISVYRGFTRTEASIATLTGFLTYLTLYIVRNTLYSHPLDYPAIASLIITSILVLIIYLKSK